MPLPDRRTRRRRGVSGRRSRSSAVTRVRPATSRRSRRPRPCPRSRGVPLTSRCRAGSQGPAERGQVVAVGRPGGRPHAGWVGQLGTERAASGTTGGQQPEHLRRAEKLATSRSRRELGSDASTRQPRLPMRGLHFERERRAVRIGTNRRHPRSRGCRRPPRHGAPPTRHRRCSDAKVPGPGVGPAELLGLHRAEALERTPVLSRAWCPITSGLGIQTRFGPREEGVGCRLRQRELAKGLPKPRGEPRRLVRQPRETSQPGPKRFLRSCSVTPPMGLSWGNLSTGGAHARRKSSWRRQRGGQQAVVVLRRGSAPHSAGRAPAGRAARDRDDVPREPLGGR